MLSDVDHEQIYTDRRRVRYEYMTESVCRYGVLCACCFPCLLYTIWIWPCLCVIGYHGRDDNVKRRRTFTGIALFFAFFIMIPTFFVLFIYQIIWSQAPPVCYHENRELCQSCVDFTRAEPVKRASDDFHWLETGISHSDANWFFEYGSREACVFGNGPIPSGSASSSLGTCHNNILSSQTDSSDCPFYESSGTELFEDGNLSGLPEDEFIVTYTYIFNSDSSLNSKDEEALCMCLGRGGSESALFDSGPYFLVYMAWHLFGLLVTFGVVYRLHEYWKLGTDLVKKPTMIMAPVVVGRNPRVHPELHPDDTAAGTRIGIVNNAGVNQASGAAVVQGTHRN